MTLIKSNVPVVLICICLAVVGAFVLPDVAAAASTNFGKNIGKMLEGWGTWLLIGVMAIIFIPRLFDRDGGKAAQALVGVFIVGAMIVAPTVILDIIESIMKQIGNGA